jgi:PAS domain-containing protein
MPSAACDGIVDYQVILDLLPMGACIIDRELRVCAWNLTLVEWTGISREGILEKRLTEYFPRLATWCFRDRLAQVFEQGTPAIFSAAFHKYFIAVEVKTGAYSGHMLQQTVVRPLDPQREKAFILIQDVTAQFLQMEELRERRSDCRVSR